MKMPGFTAEASVEWSGIGNYPAVAQTAVCGENVQPATYFFDGYTHTGPPIWALCRKWLCYIGTTGQISCNYYPGMWNPATGRCE
jgi:hypothetical protein